jgi:hypothetical protein
VLLLKPPQTIRNVRVFDLITPAGEIHRYPEPTLLQRAVMWLYSSAEPIILSAVVLGLVYSAGVLAESLEPLASDACAAQVRSWQDA